MSAVDGTFTVNDVIVPALKKSGIQGLGQSVGGEDTLDVQNDLSNMLAQWNVKTWLVWEKLDLGFVSDGRSGTGGGGVGGPYTVGPGGNYNITPRPDRVEAAYVRILPAAGAANLAVDQQLVERPAMENYAAVALKALVAFPKAYFYQSGGMTTAGSNLGNIYFYPWPSASIYEMHIVVKNAFPLTLPLNLDLSMLPPASRPAMIFNLARRLRQAYGKGLRPDPELNALAKDALTTMRNSQIQVAELKLPKAVLGRGNLYNIYSDQSY